MNYQWIAKAEYADGTEVEKTFRYVEGGRWLAEQYRQHEIEQWLTRQHDGIVWMSVDVEEVIA